MALEVVVHAGEAEEDFVRQAVVGELALLEGLDEIDVEVALGLRRGAVIRGTEEQIAHAFDAALLPLELVLPDLEAGVAQVVAALHQCLDGAVVGPVQRIVGQGFGALIDLRVVVDVLLEVEVILFRVGRLGDELPVDGLEHLPHDGLDHRQQVFGGLARHVFDTRLEQAQGVAQLGGSGADRNVDVATGGQAVNGQRVDDAHRHRLVGRASEGLLHARLQHL